MAIGLVGLLRHFLPARADGVVGVDVDVEMVVPEIDAQLTHLPLRLNAGGFFHRSPQSGAVQGNRFRAGFHGGKIGTRAELKWMIVFPDFCLAISMFRSP